MDEAIHTGLSYSGLNDLTISTLRYWARHIDPNREKPEPTPAMQFGSALGCLILEPDQFDQRYCRKFVSPEGALVTVKDLRDWVESQGLKAKGSKKDEIIEQVRNQTDGAVIADDLAAEHEEAHYGKTQFSADEWQRIKGAGAALRSEPLLAEILDDPEGEAEVPFELAYRGSRIRGILDWTTPTVTVDIKTIAIQGKGSFDDEVARAIWYRGYYRQAYIYSLARSIAAGDDPVNAQKAPRFIFAFVESSPPHETRLREMRPKDLGEVNLLWEQARREVEGGLELYQRYIDEFGAGEKPWRHAQEISPLVPEEFPALIY